MDTDVTWDVWLTVIIIGFSILSLPFILLSVVFYRFTRVTVYAWFIASGLVAILWHVVGDNWRARKLFWGNTNAYQRRAASTWTSTWLTPASTSLYIPLDEQNLRDIIIDPSTPKPIRLVGSGHTWSATGYSDGSLVDMRNFDKIIHLETYKESTTNYFEAEQTQLPLPSKACGFVTVQSGVKIQDIVHFLNQQGLCLFGVGSIRAQSVGGVVGHGVHGPHPDGFNRHVIGMRVLYANGSFADLNSDEDMFMWRSSMGMLGAIIHVTVKVFPLIQLKFENTAIKKWSELDLLNTHVDPWTSTTFTAFMYPSRCGSIGWKRVGYFHSVVNKSHELDNQTGFSSKLLLHFNNHMHPAMQYMFPALGVAMSCIEQTLSDWGHSMLLNKHSLDILPNDGLIPQFYELIDYEYMIPLKNCKTFAMELIQRQDFGRVLVPICLRLVRKEHSCLAMAYEDSCAFAIQSMRGLTHTLNFEAIERRVAELRGHAHFGKVSVTSFQYYSYPCLATFRTLRNQLDPEKKFLNTFLAYVIAERPHEIHPKYHWYTYEFGPSILARNNSTHANLIFALLSWIVIFIAFFASLFHILQNPKRVNRSQNKISNRKKYSRIEN